MDRDTDAEYGESLGTTTINSGGVALITIDVEVSNAGDGYIILGGGNFNNNNSGVNMVGAYIYSTSDISTDPAEYWTNTTYRIGSKDATDYSGCFFLGYAVSYFDGALEMNKLGFYMWLANHPWTYIDP